MTSTADSNRDFLRHALATLAYRAGKILRDAPAEYATIRIHEGARTPAEILAHCGDLLDWAHSMAIGKEEWTMAEPREWDTEKERFFTALERFDAYLASSDPLGAEPERLFQGPVADALTHVGQLALLRRAADAPVRGENFFIADIERGRVGSAQADPVYEF